MNGREMLDALGSASYLRVITKSGARYDVERDVITANAADARPFIYGWPVVPRWHRAHGRAYWFYAENVRPERVNA